MKDSEMRQLDRDYRVRQFTVDNEASFPDGTRGAELIAALNATILQAEQQAAKQDAAALDRQESTAQKDAAIKALKEQMRPINRTARSIDEQQPGIADLFKMPRDSDQATLNRARGYITNATPIANEFTKRDLPPTFLTDLQAAIDTVEAADQRQDTALANQTAATAALSAALKQLRDIVRELDNIVRNKFRTNPGLLAAWESASHIESAPEKKEETTSPPSGPPQ